MDTPTQIKHITFPPNTYMQLHKQLYVHLYPAV